MEKNVSIIDIANALNISRATVSKVLNNKPVRKDTRELVLAKTIEMGYKNYQTIAHSENIKKGKKILLLSSKTLITTNYYVYLIRGIEQVCDQTGCEFLQYTFRQYSDFNVLRDYIAQFKIDGIICIEFFKHSSISDILTLNIPTVFVDFAVNSFEISGSYDIVLMENFEAVKEVTIKLLKENMKSFCYIGNYEHCKSFNERLLGIKEAMFQFKSDAVLDMISSPDFDYGNSDLIVKELKKLKAFPSCIFCANDFIALQTLEGLRKAKRLTNTNLIGFDNVPESRLSKPKLSTINIDKTGLGKLTIKTLFERIEGSDRNNKIVYLKSSFIQRDTTPSLP